MPCKGSSIVRAEGPVFYPLKKTESTDVSENINSQIINSAVATEKSENGFPYKHKLVKVYFTCDSDTIIPDSWTDGFCHWLVYFRHCSVGTATPLSNLDLCQHPVQCCNLQPIEPLKKEILYVNISKKSQN
jgi:hypothetical protein